MRIKANIHVEYNVNPENYHLLEKYDQEQAIQVIELHSLGTAVAEVMPWPEYGVGEDQVLEVKLEE